jgi:hypothetical protein
MGISVSSGLAYTYTARLKKGELADAPDIIQIAFTSARFASGYANFNFSTGAYGTTSNVTTSTPKDLGGGVYEIAITATATSSSTAANAANVFFTNNDDGLGRAPSYLGKVTADVFVLGADLRVANESSALPPYQRVVTATDYDTTGFVPFLRFDGSNDALVTNSIDFTATDEMSVFAGVRKLGTATSIVAELSATANTNNGSAHLATIDGDKYGFQVRGTAINARSYDPYVSPITSVVTGQLTSAAASSAAASVARINAVSVAGTSLSSFASTGNFGNYPLYIGARAGTGSYFNGRLFSLVVLGRGVTPTELTQTEGYVESKTFGKDMAYVF